LRAAKVGVVEDEAQVTGVVDGIAGVVGKAALVGKGGAIEAAGSISWVRAMAGAIKPMTRSIGAPGSTNGSVSFLSS